MLKFNANRMPMSDRIKTLRDLLESGKNLKALDNTRAEPIDMYMKETG